MVTTLRMTALGVFLLAVGIAGCDRFSSRPTVREDTRPSDAVASAGQLLAGEFSNAAQATSNSGIASVHYQFVETPCVNRAAEVCFFSRRFQDVENRQAVAPRLYLLRSAVDGVRLMIEPLPAAMADLSEQKEIAKQLLDHPPAALDQECAVTLRWQGAGWLGSTDPKRCQVPVGADLRGLKRSFGISEHGITLTESLFDDGTVVAGHAEGEGIVARRLTYFVGRAGALDPATGQWTLSNPVRLANDGRPAMLQDESGRPLGYRLQLALMPPESEQPTMLRLSVMEEQSGTYLGYVWSQPKSSQIGLHIGSFQVGLRQEIQ